MTNVPTKFKLEFNTTYKPVCRTKKFVTIVLMLGVFINIRTHIGGNAANKVLEFTKPI